MSLENERFDSEHAGGISVDKMAFMLVLDR